MSYPHYAGQSPNRLSTRERINLEIKEANLAKGPSLNIFSLNLQCPDCGRKLHPIKKGSLTKEWITQCCKYHCWLVKSEGINQIMLEKIPFSDDRYPRRTLRN